MKERKIAINPPRRRYTDRFEFTSMGFFTLDRNGKILKANSSGAKLFGMELNNLLKQQFSEFVAENFRERFNAHCKQVLENQSRESCDLKLKNGDQPLYVQIESKAIKDDAKNEAHIQTTVTNITDRKRAEEALCNALEKSQQRAKEASSLLESLEHSEQRFRSVVESAIYAIITINRRGKIIFWNQQAELMFGYALDDVIGEPATIIMPERFRNAHLKKINQAPSREKRLSGEKIPSEYEIRGLKKMARPSGSHAAIH